jgi:hypothetical protein
VRPKLQDANDVIFASERRPGAHLQRFETAHKLGHVKRRGQQDIDPMPACIAKLGCVNDCVRDYKPAVRRGAAQSLEEAQTRRVGKVCHDDRRAEVAGPYGRDEFLGALVTLDCNSCPAKCASEALSRRLIGVV